MGRSSYSDRLFADGLKKVRITWLRANGYLTLGRYGGFTRGGIKWVDSWSRQENSIGFCISTFEDKMFINLYYNQTEAYGTKERINYKIPLTTTKCNFGGKRFWFICPLRKNNRYCGKRVGVLYLTDKYFGCRHCYDLTYESRNENRRSKYRPITLHWKIEERLEKLEMSIKRRYYAGRATKKQSKINELDARLRNLFL